MEIQRDRLIGVPFVRSPNVGGALKPSLIVVHFTAGRGFQESIQTLTAQSKKPVSAHAIVAKDGRCTQLVPFNRQAWHAGTSEWQGREHVNEFGIGIELDNFGTLRKADGVWKTYFGVSVPDSDVLEAAHKSGKIVRGWERFPVRQLATLFQVCSALLEAYPSITQVVGHDDIAPGRKVDPGPAFPMEKFRGWLGV